MKKEASRSVETYVILIIFSKRHHASFYTQANSCDGNESSDGGYSNLALLVVPVY